MEHENRGEVNNDKDNQSIEEERGVIDIYKEITKAINAVSYTHLTLPTSDLV